MNIRVLRHFTGLGRDLKAGEVLDATDWDPRRRQKLQELGLIQFMGDGMATPATVAAPSQPAPDDDAPPPRAGVGDDGSPEPFLATAPHRGRAARGQQQSYR